VSAVSLRVGQVTQRAWRGLDAELFRFSTGDHRALYLAILSAFDEAAVLAPSLNLDQVRAALLDVGWDEPLADDALQRALTALTDDWRLLEATQDHGAHYKTPEDFERKNLQWSLTPRGGAAVSGVLQALTALRTAIGLQTAVLDAIGDDLHELASLVGRPATPATDGQVHIKLAQVERHHHAMIDSVRQFNGHLQRLLREDGTDDQVFVDVKRRTISYLEEYVQGVERPQRRIAAGVAAVEGTGLETVFDRALSGANLAPLADGDPGPAWLDDRSRRWRALRAWFAPRDLTQPRIAALIDVARRAIIELLRVLERRWDSRRRSASIATDFRTLGRLFAAAPGDLEAHRLFAAAFGIWPARHADHPSIDGQARQPNESWLITEPAEVAPALRTTGQVTNRGRSHPVADPSLLRARRQREQVEQLAVHEELRGSLITDGAVRLSAFGDLDPEAFAELLTLLSYALDARADTNGSRRALSADGEVEVVLASPADGASATLRTRHGTLRAPDFRVSITTTVTVVTERRLAEA
jgi:uncharacterized protein (TIGR02677 family)